MRPGWRSGAIHLLLAAVLASGCQSARLPIPVAATLPPPKLRIATYSPSLAPEANTTGRVSPPLSSQPTRGAAIEGDLRQMAREVYGDALIESIQIPSIQVDAPVVPVGWQAADLAGEQPEWESPDASVGWAVASALPGQDGNIILYGHNNLHANVFLRLGELAVGEQISLRSGQGRYSYQVETVEILPVRDAQADAAAAGRFLRLGGDPRVTIISCWPPTGNSHRVIVIAKPVDREQFVPFSPQ